MSLPPALHSLLLNGPGSVALRSPAIWRLRRCPRRRGPTQGRADRGLQTWHSPWALWRFQLGGPKPAGEAGELRAIKKLGLCRDESERLYVERRLGELVQRIRERRNLSRVA